MAESAEVKCRKAEDPTSQARYYGKPETKFVNVFEDDDPFMEDEEIRAIRYKIGPCYMEDLNRMEKSSVDGFAYYDDVQVYKYKEEMWACRKILRMLQGSSDWKINFDVNILPNEFFHKKMNLRYGALQLNPASENYKRLFESFRMGLKSMYAAKISETNRLLRTMWDQGFSRTEVPAILMKALKPQIPMLFMKERIKTHGNAIEVGIVGEKKVPVKSSNNFVTEKRKRQNATESKIVYSFGTSDDEKSIFFQKVASRMERKTFTQDLKFPLVLSILKVLYDFPLGCTAKFLRNEFAKRNNYEIDHLTLGFKHFGQLLKENGCAFRVVDHERFKLVFPYWIHGKINVNAIMKELFHDIVLLVVCNKVPVALDEVTEELYKKFGKSVSPAAWGINDDDLFYRSIICEFDPNGDFLQLVRSNQRETTGELRHMVQIPEHKEDIPETDTFWEKFMLTQQVRATNVDCLQPPVEPEENPETESENEGSEEPQLALNSLDLVLGDFRDNFVLGAVTTIARGSEFFRSGERIRAIPEYTVTPGRFYVSDAYLDEFREAFMYQMTQAYATWIGDEELSPVFQVRAEDVILGSYVALYFETDWVRGRVVSIRKKKYKIFMVDLGVYAKDKSLEDLKYLHHLFGKVQEFSFCCSLSQDRLIQAYGSEAVDYDDYPEAALNKFYGLVRQKMLVVLLIRKLKKCDIWEVDLFSDWAEGAVEVDLTKELIGPCNA